MEILMSILRYLLDVILTTLSQLFILLGPLLLLAFIMNYVARANEHLSYNVLGRRLYLYGFGWLGTSVHEIGHAIFALIFGHNITEMKLFTPGSDGSLGHVNHSYKKNSLYQRIGNFFVGIGPILLGSIMLYVITFLLFRIKATELTSFSLTADSLTSLEGFKSLGNAVWTGFLKYMDAVLNNPYSVWWKLVIFFYLLYAIGSSVTLSAADVSGALDGLIIFVICLFLFNLGTLWIGDFTIRAFRTVSSFFSGFYFLIILSMTVSLGFILVLLILRFLKGLIRRR
jgi:hypothetical protein